jgi:tripartite-type tricarboxylate transporter receptor subunit TctC
MKGAAFLAALAIAGAAFAQADKPVHIVVPFPPGGGADALARIMAPSLAERWKTQVLVENKPGASGRIGADQVAQSPADGKTLLMSSTGALTENNVSQFAPISLVSASPYVVVSSLKRDFSSLADMLTYARSNPGKLSFGSSGTGAASHLSGELFKSMAKVDLLHVPYKGMGQATTDLLAGQIDLLFAPAQAVMQHVRPESSRRSRLRARAARRRCPSCRRSPNPASRLRVDRLVRASRARGDPEGDGRAPERGRESRARGRRREEKDPRPGSRSCGQFAGGVRALHPDDQAKWARLARETGLKLD